MHLRIRHVSGSKAGQEQTFDSESITIGRDPSSDVAYDPDNDIVVSAHHAELSFDGQHWTIKDLGSTNGTWIDGERLKSRRLQSGDSLQLGERGPKLQLSFDPSGDTTSIPVDRPGTGVMSVGDLLGGRQTAGGNRMTPPPSGGTTMLSAGELAALRNGSAPPPARHDVRPPSKRSSVLRVVLLLALVVAVVIIAAIAGKKTPSATPKREVVQTSAETETLRAELAGREAELARLRQQMQTPPPSTSTLVSADLERQYRTSQELIDRLRQELEQKNDELRRKQEQLASAANRPARTVVRYVPVPQPASTASTPSDNPAVSIQPSAAQSAAVPQPSSPIAVTTLQAPANTTAAPYYQPPPATGTYNPQPSAPAIVTSPRQSTPAVPRPIVAPQQTPIVVASAAPDERLLRLKSIRKRVNISDLGSSANAVPSEVGAELVRSIGAALASTRSYLVDRNGALAVRITPTNFHAKADPKVNTSRAVGAIRGIGSILGKSVPNTPAGVTTVSYDVALAATVTVYDGQGRELASAFPQCALQQTRSNVEITPARLSFGQAAGADTPIADAVRQVVAGATDEVISALASMEGDVSVTSARGQSMTIDAGRNANIAPDDVFDLFDGGRAIARIRIDSVQDSTATATIVWGETTGLSGKRGRYVGSPASTSAMRVDSSREERIATVREKSDLRDGPGKSFKVMSSLPRGNRVRFVYAIGPWARVQSGSTFGWIATSSVDLQ